MLDRMQLRAALEELAEHGFAYVESQDAMDVLHAAGPGHRVDRAGPFRRIVKVALELEHVACAGGCGRPVRVDNGFVGAAWCVECAPRAALEIPTHRWTGPPPGTWNPDPYYDRLGGGA